MSEFSIIQEFFSRHYLPDGYGVGDDCAILNTPTNQQMVICTDTLVSGRHFPVDTSPYAIGYKAVAVNLSDIAAMGAKPHSILLALSLPTMDKAWLSAFSDGLYQICDAFDVKLIGGDTTRSDKLTITITALGFATSAPILRSGAKVGDLVCVSGQMGSAAFALHHPTSSLRHRLDYPLPQVLFGQALQGYASSMIDVSDGLAQDLGHIAASSDVNAKLYLDKVPLHPELQALPWERAMEFALTGGDDYELCFTIAPSQLAQFQAAYPEFSVYVIGEITDKAPDGGAVMLYYYDKPYSLNTRGYDHFQS